MFGMSLDLDFSGWTRGYAEAAIYGARAVGAHDISLGTFWRDGYPALHLLCFDARPICASVADNKRFRRRSATLRNVGSPAYGIRAPVAGSSADGQRQEQV